MGTKEGPSTKIRIEIMDVIIVAFDALRTVTVFVNFGTVD